MTALPRTLTVPLITSLLLSLCIPAAGQDNELCLECHGEEDITGILDGKERSMFIDQKTFSESVHADMPCTGCHIDLEDVDDYPHNEQLQKAFCGNCHDQETEQFAASIHGDYLPAGVSRHKIRCSDCHGTHDIYSSQDRRAKSFHCNIPKTCSQCHSSIGGTEWQDARLRKAYDYYAKSIHGKAVLQWELTLAATCVDCHGFHDIRPYADPKSHVNRRSIVETCGRCHVGAVQRYNQGIHGKAFAEGIQESAVCTDCHTEHGVRSPLDRGSHVYVTSIVSTCSRCHADKEIVAKYGISVETVSTYQHSYHGIGQKYGSMVIANCVSCHKYHDIKPAGDPSSSINPDNLRETCGQPRCHVGATKEFVRGKTHSPVTSGQRRVVNVVRVAYIFLIALSLSGMFLHNVLDLRSRFRRSGKAESEPEGES
ncbi:cytochrome c3 family protein [Acidobacteriota bacterium]